MAIGQLAARPASDAKDPGNDQRQHEALGQDRAAGSPSRNSQFTSESARAVAFPRACTQPIARSRARSMVKKSIRPAIEASATAATPAPTSHNEARAQKTSAVAQ
jgi:hypothetical protein